MTTDMNANRSEVRDNQPEGLFEIDPIELLGVLLKKWWAILIGAVVGGAIAALITVYIIVPTYQATATIYIYSKTTSITSLADLQVGTSLTADFQIIAKTREVINQVINDLDMESTYEGLVGRVSIVNPEGSHMLQVTVTDSDPQLAADISNTLADRLRDQIAEIMNTDRPSVAERAVAPGSPSAPNLRNNMLIGVLIGAALIIGYYFVIYVMDDSIKTEEDIVKHLGITLLATIPYDDDVLGFDDLEKRYGFSNQKRGKYRKYYKYGRYSRYSRYGGYGGYGGYGRYGRYGGYGKYGRYGGYGRYGKYAGYQDYYRYQSSQNQSGQNQSGQNQSGQKTEK